MYCIACGKKGPDGAALCAWCGSKLPELAGQAESAWEALKRRWPGAWLTHTCGEGVVFRQE